MEHSPVLTPVVVLIAWSLVMWLWMYATRIPAIRRAGVRLDPEVPPRTLMEQLPARVRWKADNYNHLMEQPTLFYAVALVLAMGDAGSGLNVIFAWFYVVLRIVHSLVQALVNNIALRFGIFVLSTIPLFGLTWGALKMVFGF
jgi:hypothetical protein